MLEGGLSSNFLEIRIISFHRRSMAPTTRRNGKSPMSFEQELLEERLRHMEDSMALMSGLVETLVQNESQPLLLTDRE